MCNHFFTKIKNADFIASNCLQSSGLNWAEILLVYIIFLDVASGESLLHWEPSAYVWISVLSSSISRILAQNLLSSPSSCLYINRSIYIYIVDQYTSILFCLVVQAIFFVLFWIMLELFLLWRWHILNIFLNLLL